MLAVAGSTAASRKEAIFERCPFGALVGPARAAFLQAPEVETWVAGRVLTIQGGPSRALFLIGAGRVRVERTRGAGGAGQASFPVGHRGPGEMVGEASLVSATAAETAVVADAGDALAIGVDPFRRLLAAAPSLREASAAALVAQHRQTQRRLETLLLHGVEVRLARLLVDAAARWGTSHPSGELVGAGFTHADVALLIGSTRETVTLLLGKLRRQGLVAFERRRMVIRDRAGLERLAAVDD